MKRPQLTQPAPSPTPTSATTRARSRPWAFLPFAVAPPLLAASALWHPGDENGAEAYASVADAPAQWFLSHLAGATGAALAVVAGLLLARWARGLGAKGLVVAGYLLAVGGFGFFAEQVGHGWLMSALVSGEAGPEAGAAVWDAYLDMPETALISVLSGLFILGFATAGVAAIRRPDLPTWWGASLVVFVVLSMVAGTAGPAWILFGALLSVPMWLLGRRVAADRAVAAA